MKFFFKFDTFISPFLCTIGLTIVILFIIYTSIKTYQYHYWGRQGIIQLYRNSLIGVHAPFYFQEYSFPDHTINLYNVYTKHRYYGAFDWFTPVIVLRDPTIIRNIFVKNFDCFNGHQSFISEEMDSVLGRNIFSLTGPRWEAMRSSLSPNFTISKMRAMIPLVFECSKKFFECFENQLDHAACFDSLDMFTRFATDVIAVVVLGLQVDSFKDRENKFYQYCQEVASISSSWKLLAFRLFPRLMRLFKIRFLSCAAHKFFKYVIENTLEERKKLGVIQLDILDSLLHAKSKKKECLETMNSDDMMAQIVVFLMAGVETISSLMQSLSYVLVSHIDVQKKVQQEIDMLLPKNDETITHEHLKDMKYFNAVVSETLRMYPAAPMNDRLCNKKVVLPGCADGFLELEVQIGTNIVVPVHGLHNDPQYFPEPEKFIPERFNDENKDRIQPFTYMPFGIGPRMCIGNRFALMEVKIFFVSMLRKYNLSFSDKKKHSCKLCKGSFGVKFDGGLWLKLEKRQI